MASVSIRRREASFQVRFRLGGRGYPYVHGGSFKTQKEAKLRRDAIAGELAAGRNPAALLEALATPPAPPEPVATLTQGFDAFIASRVDVSASTLALYRNARDSLGELAERDPATLTAADFQAWVARNAKLSPRTLAHYLCSIRQALDFADVEPNPARSKKGAAACRRERRGRGSLERGVGSDQAGGLEAGLARAVPDRGVRPASL